MRDMDSSWWKAALAKKIELARALFDLMCMEATPRNEHSLKSIKEGITVSRFALHCWGSRLLYWNYPFRVHFFFISYARLLNPGFLLLPFHNTFRVSLSQPTGSLDRKVLRNVVVSIMLMIYAQSIRSSRKRPTSIAICGADHHQDKVRRQLTISMLTKNVYTKPTPTVIPTRSALHPGFLSLYQVTSPAKNARILQSSITSGLHARARSLRVQLVYPSYRNKSIVPSIAEITAAAVDETIKPSAIFCSGVRVGWNSWN